MRYLKRFCSGLCCLALISLAACGDNGADGQNGDDQEENGHIERPDSLQERCEAGCERVYDDEEGCDLRFADEDGAVSQQRCVDECVNHNLFRGGEWCVATEAECADEPQQMIDACLPDDYHPEACEHLGAWSRELEEFEQNIVELVNDLRSDGAECEGEEMPAVDAVEVNAELRCAARLYSKKDVDENVVGWPHISDDEAQNLAEDAGYVGEVLGIDAHHGHVFEEDLVDLWMEDDPQCSMIMDEDAEQIGFGRYYQERSTVIFGRE